MVWYGMWYVVCGMWYVVCGMWYVVCGMWYVVCGMVCMYVYTWVNYNALTTSSLEIIVSKGNHPQMALIQISELL